MTGDEDQHPRRSTRRLWGGLAAAVVLSAGLVLGVAAPSQAAVKARTAVTLKAVSWVDLGQRFSGNLVTAGDKADLTGTTSANLVGATLHVQEESATKGARWHSVTGSGTVKASKTFSIRITASGLGKQTYRVTFSGSPKRSASSGSRTVTVFDWFPLVSVPILDSVQAGGDQEPHLVASYTVAGTHYDRLIAGIRETATPAYSEWALHGHCGQFNSDVGMSNSASSGVTGNFSDGLDGVVETEYANLPVGTLGNILRETTGAKVLRLQNSATVPAGGGAVAITAWPNAAILCSVKP